MVYIFFRQHNFVLNRTIHYCFIQNALNRIGKWYENSFTHSTINSGLPRNKLYSNIKCDKHSEHDIDLICSFIPSDFLDSDSSPLLLLCYCVRLYWVLVQLQTSIDERILLYCWVSYVEIRLFENLSVCGCAMVNHVYEVFTKKHFPYITVHNLFMILCLILSILYTFTVFFVRLGSSYADIVVFVVALLVCIYYVRLILYHRVSLVDCIVIVN